MLFRLNPTVDRASYRYARVTLLARGSTVPALFSTGITLDEMPKRSIHDLLTSRELTGKGQYKRQKTRRLWDNLRRAAVLIEKMLRPFYISNRWKSAIRHHYELRFQNRNTVKEGIRINLSVPYYKEGVMRLVSTIKRDIPWEWIRLTYDPWPRFITTPP